MGSLMAGWDSTVQDPQTVKYQRNRSLTKVEIDAYWKSKKRTEEEHLSALSGHLNDSQQENLHEEPRKRLYRSNSLPLADRKETTVNKDSKKDDQRLNMASCWWTRSNWAFLNEPPVITTDGTRHKYASQYNVTEFGSSKMTNNSGISA